MSRLTHIAAALTATVALLLSGCTGTPAPKGAPGGAPEGAPERQQPQADHVQRLRLAGLRGFGYPSPFAWVRGPGWLITGLSFDTLLWEDSTGEPIPWLASEWEESEDGMEWRFTLQEDATWQDGEPVTAQDVAFTVEYMTQGPGAEAAGFAAQGLEVVEEAVAQSDDVVVFRLNRPHAAFVEDVAASVLIVPEHIWAGVDDPARMRGPEATMGSGPYRLEAVDEAAGSLLYVANEDFYLGTPHVGRLEFVPVDDELLALQRGELDAAEAGLEDPVPDQQLEAFEADPRFERLEEDGSWNRALHFNLQRGFPYADVRFRHAVAYAIDRRDLIDRVLFGHGEPGSTGGLAPAHEFTADGLPAYEHDVTQANALLDELGMRDTDGDGFRELPGGSPFVQELKASNRFSPKTPELIKEYLREVGINVQVNVLDQPAADEAGGQGDYTITLAGYGGLMGDPDSLRTRFSSRVRSRTFSRPFGYANERFDELAAQQLVTVDPDRRRELIVEMQQIIAQDVPSLSLYVPDDTMFFNREVFDAWYFTPGCSPCGGTRNKHMFVTGQQTGF